MINRYCLALIHRSGLPEPLVVGVIPSGYRVLQLKREEQNLMCYRFFFHPLSRLLGLTTQNSARRREVSGIAWIAWLGIRHISEAVGGWCCGGKIITLPFVADSSTRNQLPQLPAVPSRPWSIGALSVDPNACLWWCGVRDLVGTSSANKRPNGTIESVIFLLRAALGWT